MFAKTLRKDLEIAADFNISTGHDDFLRKLEETNHVQVTIHVYVYYVLSAIFIKLKDKRLLGCIHQIKKTFDTYNQENMLILKRNKRTTCFHYDQKLTLFNMKKAQLQKELSAAIL